VTWQLVEKHGGNLDAAGVPTQDHPPGPLAYQLRSALDSQGILIAEISSSTAQYTRPEADRDQAPTTRQSRMQGPKYDARSSTALRSWSNFTGKNLHVYCIHDR
jgi:hypothetical protein